MNMKKIFALMIAFVGLAPLAGAQILRTRVAQGEIEGELHNGFALYKAIPYAEAPVGDLRWKAPVPKAPWQGVYKAADWAPKPFQPQADPAGMSEDCLYLSVETPAKSVEEKLPVFVMIHGGAFLTGTYAGTQDSFVKEGIVYVSVEYRLGVLGFMAHPELSKESKDGISGNYGIYDQICALNWIHDNIQAFGGDPDKVTICGESAGGISVSILCASPLCKGLFRAAISESGSSFCPAEGGSVSAYPVDFRQAENAGLQLQGKLGGSKGGAKNLKAMRKADALSIANNAPMGLFWPVIDGKAIIGDQYELYRQGRYNDVDVMVGYNSDEGSLFVHQMDMDSYNGLLQGTFGPYADKARLAYPAANAQEAKWAAQDIFRDNAFGWGTWAWANLQSRTGKSRVYMYYFSQHSQNSIMKDCRGATHVAEMPFVYGWQMGPMTDAEKKMSDIMARYWINFIKTGDPNTDGSGNESLMPFWSTYRQGEATVMEMREGFHLIPAPNQTQMDFWEDFFSAKRAGKL